MASTGKGGKQGQKALIPEYTPPQGIHVDGEDEDYKRRLQGAPTSGDAVIQSLQSSRNSAIKRENKDPVLTDY